VSNANILTYNTTTSEITFVAKTFVIDHPTKSDNYLVHACLEGPEAGVYYRGTAFVDGETAVELPEYTTAFTDFTVTASPCGEGNECKDIPIVAASRVINGTFTLRATAPTKVHWVAHGKRLAIDTEPDKAVTRIVGEGPYKWIA
jgi:hypothetical protein